MATSLPQRWLLSFLFSFPQPVLPIWKNKRSFCWEISQFKGHLNFSDELKASFPCCMFRTIYTVRRVQLPSCWWNFVGRPDTCVLPCTGAPVPGGETGYGTGRGGREPSFTGFSGADWWDRLAGCQWWHYNSVHFIVVSWRILVVIKVCNAGALF